MIGKRSTPANQQEHGRLSELEIDTAMEQPVLGSRRSTTIATDPSIRIIGRRWTKEDDANG